MMMIKPKPTNVLILSTYHLAAAAQLAYPRGALDSRAPLPHSGIVVGVQEVDVREAHVLHDALALVHRERPLAREDGRHGRRLRGKARISWETLTG